jgi:ABC-type Mn2+/Zn2+ transport system permease subunit
MANLGISRLRARPASAVLLRYGLVVSWVAAALGAAVIQQHHHSLPRSISHFTVIAIAITFWYAGQVRSARALTCLFGVEPTGLTVGLCGLVRRNTTKEKGEVECHT